MAINSWCGLPAAALPRIGRVRALLLKVTPNHPMQRTASKRAHNRDNARQERGEP